MRRLRGSWKRVSAAVGAVACAGLALAPAAHATGSRPSYVSFAVYNGDAGPVTGDARVGWADGDYAPRTGTIEVHDAQRSYGTVNADDGWRPGQPLPAMRDNFSFGELPAGTYTMTAVYSGDDTFAPSSKSTTFTLSVRPSVTSVTSPSEASRFCKPGPGCPIGEVAQGSTVVIYAHAGNVGEPTVRGPAANGTAVFSDGDGKDLASVPMNDGRATWSTNSLSLGLHSIAVRFTGSDYYEPSTSQIPVMLRVVAAGSPTTATSAGAATSAGTAQPTSGAESQGSTATKGTTTRATSSGAVGSGSTKTTDGESPTLSAESSGASSTASIDAGEVAEGETAVASDRPASDTKPDDGGGRLLWSVAAVLLGASAAGATAVALRRRRNVPSA